ncbi:MAG: hybrid sensor histidine kinase/response regulator [Desulfobulbaceae bacterium]
MGGGNGDMASMSMMDLFRQEAENHCGVLSEKLLLLEKDPADQEALAELMRAAHSIKGAARIMDLDVLVGLAHAMEDGFVAAQKGRIVIDGGGVDLLLEGVDLLGKVAGLANEDVEQWLQDNRDRVNALRERLEDLAEGKPAEESPSGEEPVARETEGEVAGDERKDASAQEEVPEEAVPAPKAESGSAGEPGGPESPGRKKEKKRPPLDLSSMSMMDLFRQEAEIHCETLSDNLLVLEKNPEEQEALAALMRAAHSIKGAARVIDLHMVVGLAHAMEDVFVAAQEGRITLNQDQVDLLLRGTDIFSAIAEVEESQLNQWFTEQEAVMRELEGGYRQLAAGKAPDVAAQPRVKPVKAPAVPERPPPKPEEPSAMVLKAEHLRKPERKKTEKTDSGAGAGKKADRFLRVSAEGMNRLMGYAGEVQVESRWLPSFAQKILHLKHRQDDVHRLLGIYAGTIGSGTSEELSRSGFRNLIARLDQCRSMVSELLEEAEDHARRATEISHHLYQEVLANRMRPFSDGIRAFPRMVRDLARELGKKVDFQVIGEDTLVDRDILEKIEAPLNHLIRNALDHGVEPPEKRVQAGKPETAVIRLEAKHSAGMLNITVSDDGPGIDIEKLRRAVIDRKMIAEDMAHQLRENELLEFIFLPNFSTRDSVSKVSGRGVGMDVVHSAVHEVRGIIRTSTEKGVGTTFELQLPLTLSVMRTLLVEICDEIYAFPLVAIDHVIRLQEEVREIEGRQYITFNNERIGLVSANQVLEKEERKREGEDEELQVVVISDRYNRYGLIVDRFLEIRDLVVQPLDRRLKKVRDVSSVAILEDGTPVLIVDVEDLVRSIDALISGNRLHRIGTEELMVERSVKRILVVDDSITVREVERKMLANKGYDVRAAVDGLDGWNTLRSDEFDLVVTDIDMPRMDGIEFVTLMRQDPRYESIPVIIVSYKDREEDRRRGLEAGADYYLTKGSFQDETLVRTVEELIGPPHKKELNRA